MNSTDHVVVNRAGAEGVRLDAALLQQLSIGLSAYRLFPGNLEQAGFAAAVERIRAAAQRALQADPRGVVAELRGQEFHTRAGVIPHDEVLDRLAIACYERRAERLGVTAAPTAVELGALYDALSTSIEDVSARGGLGAVLRMHGVSSIVLDEVAPTGDPDVNVEISAEERDLWDRLQEMLFHAGETEDATVDPAERAEALFRQFQDVLAALPEGLVDDLRVYRKLHQVVATLPDAVRRGLTGRLIRSSTGDPMTGRVIGALTDAELARIIVDLAAEGGSDPLELARSMIEHGGRREGLVELTAAAQAGREEAGTIVLPAADTPAGGAIGAPPAEGSVPETVSDLMARGLLAVAEEDMSDLVADFPSDDLDHAAIALVTFADYLRLEDDDARLGQALEVWSEGVRAALRRHDGDELERLLRPVQGARAVLQDAASARDEVFGAYCGRVLDPAVLGDLVATTGEDTAETVSRLLGPFGGEAVDGLMDLLADESDRGRRAAIVGLLVKLAPGHHDRVAARLHDPRWYVVRNAITVLRRSAPAEVAALLTSAARHSNAGVRKEAVWGLVAAGPGDALPVLRRLVSDPDAGVRAMAISALGGLVAPEAATALADVVRGSVDPEDRRRALEQLARHPAHAAAVEGLRSIAGRTRPRLPRRIRKAARDVLTEREAVA